ncbi:MAG: lipoyl synthase, partial [Elusimicrobiota bacterium]
RPFGVEPVRRTRQAGLWAGGRRLAFISAGTLGLVSSHGFHININCDLAPWIPITKRGDPGWTSLAELLGRPQDETAAARSVAEAFLRYF